MMGRTIRRVAFIWLTVTILLLGACGSDEEEGSNAEQPNNDEPNAEQPNAEEPNAEDPNQVANTNQCEPDTCHSISAMCGEHSDGCDGTINCGVCVTGSCVDGQCVEDTPAVEPVVTIDEAPDDPSDESSATFEFSCDQSECDFECALDGDSDSCTSPMTYDGLPDGKRHFQVRGIVAGESGDWAEHTWIIDTEEPAVVGLSGPADPSGQTDATFEFDCSKDECDFFCSLDGGDFEPCDSGVSYSGLAEGAHIFEVYATDWFDNESDVATWEWSIDGDVPDVVDLQGPDDPTNSTSATFTFGCSKSNCDFECSLDGAAFEACDAGISYDNLDDGEHHFEVRPIDESGTTGGVAQWGWTVDTQAPEVVITAAPETETEALDALFGFSCTDDECVEFACALDTEQGDGTFSACSSPKLIEDLQPGIYLFNVRGIDAAGNVGETAHIWEVVTATATGWSAVAPGERHTCAIANTGELFCWGGNDYGQLGDGTEDAQSAPTQVGSADDWIHVSAGSWHSCGIREDHSLYCWGRNNDGQLGDGSKISQSAPVAENEGWSWTQVAAGGFHTCGIRDDDTLWCWGDNLAGQLGDGSQTESSVPVQVGEASDWTHVSPSKEFHSCGRRANGTLWCWGANFDGALGDGSDEHSDVPVQVGVDEDWSEVGTGNGHSCGRRDNGELWCWGDNERLQAGDQGEDELNAPAQVGSDGGWDSLSVGGDHNCALHGDGAISCWGSNADGALGDGTDADSGVPVAVDGASDWVSVTAGNRSSCGLRDDQSLWCWGLNDSGQLGSGSDMSSNIPVEVPLP